MLWHRTNTLLSGVDNTTHTGFGCTTAAAAMVRCRSSTANTQQCCKPHRENVRNFAGGINCDNVFLITRPRASRLSTFTSSLPLSLLSHPFLDIFQCTDPLYRGPVQSNRLQAKSRWSQRMGSLGIEHEYAVVCVVAGTCACAVLSVYTLYVNLCRCVCGCV